MSHKPGGSRQGNHLRRCGRGVHEPEAGAGGGFGLVQAAHDRGLAADLLDVAEGLFLDSGQSALDVALGRLGVGQIACLVVVDDLGVAVEIELEVLAHCVIDATLEHKMLAAGQFRGFAEEQGGALFIQLVVGVADGGVGGDAGGGVGFAALGGDPQFADVTLGALVFGGHLHEFLGLAGCGADGVVLAVLLDGEADNRLAGLGDAFDDAVGPLWFDADDDDGGNVRVAARADQRAEIQVQIVTELQAAIGMRQGHGALDVVRHRFASGVGQVVQGQDDNMVTNAHTAIFTTVSEKFSLHELPPLGFDVVDVQVFAFLDGSHDLSDVGIVFENCIASGEIFEGQFVPDRDVADDLDFDGLVFFHDPACDFLIGFQALNNHYSNAISGFVYQKIDSHVRLLKRLNCRIERCRNLLDCIMPK